MRTAPMSVNTAGMPFSWAPSGLTPNSPMTLPPPNMYYFNFGVILLSLKTFTFLNWEVSKTLLILDFSPPPGFVPLPTPELQSPSQQSSMGFFQSPQMHQRGMPSRASPRFFSPHDPRPKFVGNQQSWTNQHFQDNPNNRRRSEEYSHNEWKNPKRVRRGGSTNYD